MDLFINKQINSFNGKKYQLNNIKDNSLFKVIIKNNKIISNKNFSINKREGQVLLILNELLKRKKINDTILLINLADGYYWKNDYPVFNFALPDNIKGLIFPSFDILHFWHLKKNFNEIKKNFNDYRPKKVINNIYLKGAKSSLKKTKIREKLCKEDKPLI